MQNKHDNAEEVRLILDGENLYVKRQDGAILRILVDGVTHAEHSSVVSGEVKVQLPRNSFNPDRWPSYVGRNSNGERIIKY